MVTIELTNISKTFGSLADRQGFVLEDISFVARAGETVVLHGPNGCGKSTLLNIVAALIPASDGTVRGTGFSYPQSPVAYVFQDYSASLLPWLSVAENITLPLRLNGLGRTKRTSVLERTLNELGFDQIPLRRSPITLSGGQRQKACIARAVITPSPLLLMDEPFSSLDRESKLGAERLVHELRSRGDRIVVLVIHDLDDAISLADRIICLDSSPTRLVADISVPLGWPRDPSVRTDSRFLTIREEVLRRSGAI